MTVNIYDDANQMATNLQTLPQFLGLQKCFCRLKKDDIAFTMFKKFQTQQMTLQQKQMQGEELTDDEIKEIQELAQKIGDIDAIKNLMEQERQLSQLMDELNQIISKPIADIYQG
ncbi:YlbF family regulator [Latilactobacillus sakei]